MLATTKGLWTIVTRPRRQFGQSIASVGEVSIERRHSTHQISLQTAQHHISSGSGGGISPCACK
jgi:hypothetical protein